jgi:ParB-like chromosome segregation protein Spo0J
MSVAENLQREDLSAIEMIEVIVKIVDVELIEDIEYQRSEGGDRKTEVRGRSQGIRVQRAEVLGRKS